MWAKLDDRFPNHPKVARAGGDAAWLYVAALCYANAHLTDGEIPLAVVPRLTDRRGALALAERLVEVGLWERSGDGFAIHDYHDENDTADTVRAKREALSAKRKAAGLAGGRRSGEVRKALSMSASAGNQTHQATKQLASSKQSNLLQAKQATCFDQIEAPTKPDADADADANKNSHSLARTPARDPTTTTHTSEHGQEKAVLIRLWEEIAKRDSGPTGYLDQLTSKLAESARRAGVPFEERTRVLLAAAVEMAADWRKRSIPATPTFRWAAEKFPDIEGWAAGERVQPRGANGAPTTTPGRTGGWR